MMPLRLQEQCCTCLIKPMACKMLGDNPCWPFFVVYVANPADCCVDMGVERVFYFFKEKIKPKRKDDHLEKQLFLKLRKKKVEE